MLKAISRKRCKIGGKLVLISDVWLLVFAGSVWSRLQYWNFGSIMVTVRLQIGNSVFLLMLPVVATFL